MITINTETLITGLALMAIGGLSGLCFKWILKLRKDIDAAFTMLRYLRDRRGKR